MANTLTKLGVPDNETLVYYSFNSGNGFVAFDDNDTDRTEVLQELADADLTLSHNSVLYLHDGAKVPIGTSVLDTNNFLEVGSDDKMEDVHMTNSSVKSVDEYEPSAKVNINYASLMNTTVERNKYSDILIETSSVEDANIATTGEKKGNKIIVGGAEVTNRFGKTTIITNGAEILDGQLTSGYLENSTLDHAEAGADIQNSYIMGGVVSLGDGSTILDSYLQESYPKDSSVSVAIDGLKEYDFDDDDTKSSETVINNLIDDAEKQIPPLDFDGLDDGNQQL